MDVMCLLVFVLEFILIGPIISDLVQETLDFYNKELPPISDVCYELYDSKNRLSCLEPRRKNNIKCMKYIVNGSYAISTPTNETIIFAPDWYENEDCFNIYKGDNLTNVCKDNKDDNYVSLTTPDNFTIWFEGETCEGSISKIELEESRTFIANYKFNYTKKKCYKIFEQDEKITSHTCGSTNTTEICVSQYEDCFIFKHNNEIVALGCAGTKENENFIIVLHNKNTSTVVRLEELADGCVGFVTPSGLRILVHCLKCYNDLLENVEMFQNEDSLPCYDILPNKNPLLCQEPRKKVECLKYYTKHRQYGLATPTNETILFPSIIVKTDACFNISKGGNLTKVCVENDPDGVSKSLTTPDNFTIWLFNDYCPMNMVLMNTLHFEREARYIANYKFKYKEKNCYKIFDTYEKLGPYSCQESYIADHCQEEIDNCFIITTKHMETVILGCLNETNVDEGKDCITVIYNEHHYNVCIEQLEERCVGFTTPTGLRILAECHICHYGALYYSWWSLDKCYELYEEKNVSSCREPRNETRYACVECPKGLTKCNFSTPTGETILFGPPLYEDDDCFEILKEDNLTKVCKDTNAFDTSLTTPDNFTIWLSSDNCVNTLNKEEITLDKEIIANFTFNSTKKHCYKIYAPDKKITPYTCGDTIDVYENCVEEIDNCTVMSTQNNETVIFGCSNDTTEINEYKNCIYILYDGRQHRICLEKLEERCLGFTTPSGLRILVYCVHCYDDDLSESKDQDQLLPGDPPMWLTDTCYEMYEVRDVLSCKKPMKRENVVCFQYFTQHRQFGLLTPTNEMILFVPPDYNDDCYDIHKGDKVTRACKDDDENEENHSLTTPDNFTIWLDVADCWDLDKDEMEEDDKLIANYKFNNTKKRCYKVFEMNETISPYTCRDREIEESCIEEIDDCYSIKTENNETIIFGYLNQTSNDDDDDDEEHRCVDVIVNNSTYEVCLEKLEERCLGFTIPNGSRILVYCTHCYNDELVDSVDSQEYLLPDDTPLYLIDKCYQAYEGNKSLLCREPLRKDSISCMEYLKEYHKFGIILPSKEIIFFEPPDFDNNECFEILTEDTKTEVCTETEDGNIGLTTPGNLTIWLANYHCYGDLGKEVLVEYERYVADFKFNYKDKSVYRMYEKNEIISPYTCSNVDIFKNNVEELGNCTVLKTQRHETVILGCSNQSNVKNCVNVLYNEINQQVCLEKLEERCVGFTMPSGIRILVECNDCMDQDSHTLPSAPPNIFLRNVCYEIYEEINGLSCTEPRRRDNVKCIEYYKRKYFGLSTPSSEIILFSSPNYEFSSCFDIYKGNKVRKICRETGPDGTSLTTPDNYTIWLNNKCNSFITRQEMEEEKKYVADFNFDYRKNECYNIFEENEPISPYTCGKIPGNCVQERDLCLVLTTKYNETIKFGCLGQINNNKKKNCIDVIDNTKTYQICLEKLEERCVGFTTRRGLRILIACDKCFPYDLDADGVESPKFKCYDMYQHKDIISCKESRNLTCMKFFGRERYGFTTPTNEKIVFVPPFYERAEWFNLYKGQAFPTRISKKKVVGGVKITTPDNYTVWLSNKCNRVQFQNEEKIKYHHEHGVFNVKRKEPRRKY